MTYSMSLIYQQLFVSAIRVQNDRTQDMNRIACGQYNERKLTSSPMYNIVTVALS